MSTKEYMTREELSDWLKSQRASDLEVLAREKGLVIGGSGKEGKTTKKDLVSAVGALYANSPTHYEVTLVETPYHNGGIVGGVAANWFPGQTRVVSTQALEQIKSDVGESRVRDMFQVGKNLFSIGG